MIDLRKYFFVVDEYSTQIGHFCFETKEDAIKECERLGMTEHLILNFEELEKFLDKIYYISYCLNP